MTEYFERDNFITRIEYYITHTPKSSGEHYAYSIVLNEILNCPTADVAPVRHGRWKRYGKNLGECSECGEVVAIRNNFCPNCGAKMDGERKGEANES